MAQDTLGTAWERGRDRKHVQFFVMVLDKSHILVCTILIFSVSSTCAAFQSLSEIKFVCSLRVKKVFFKYLYNYLVFLSEMRFEIFTRNN